jgi:hypothetical protein
MGENPLINLDALTKPAVVLIEKISDAVGGIAKPWQIVRVAKAEANAERIKAESRMLSDLEIRAMNRFLTEEAKRQSNIEVIAQKALPLVGEQAKPENVEDDWITNFFDKCRIVSDDQMQNLWSRILAGEANSPGAFSRKTVNLVADLGKGDAELFTALCGFTWEIGDMVPIVFHYRDHIYSRQGIHFDSLRHLESLGLLQFGGSGHFQTTGLSKKLSVSYYGKTVELVLPRDADNQILVGQVLLTRMGTELATVTGSGPVDGFFEFVYDRWAGQGLVPPRVTEGDAPADGPV